MILELAASKLLLGSNVIVNAVNAVPEARAGWRSTAHAAAAELIVVQTSLTDADEHRRRVENRTPDISGHRVPTWSDVQQDGWVCPGTPSVTVLELSSTQRIALPRSTLPLSAALEN